MALMLYVKARVVRDATVAGTVIGVELLTVKKWLLR